MDRVSEAMDPFSEEIGRFAGAMDRFSEAIDCSQIEKISQRIT